MNKHTWREQFDAIQARDALKEAMLAAPTALTTGEYPVQISTQLSEKLLESVEQEIEFDFIPDADEDVHNLRDTDIDEAPHPSFRGGYKDE